MLAIHTYATVSVRLLNQFFTEFPKQSSSNRYTLAILLLIFNLAVYGSVFF